MGDRRQSGGWPLLRKRSYSTIESVALWTSPPLASQNRCSRFLIEYFGSPTSRLWRPPQLRGDSDLVSAMKFARREGLRVYLDTLGSHHVRPELKVHADRVL